MAFKDIIIFNKIIDPGGGSYVYGNSGTGELKNANGIGSPNPNLMPSDTLKNFAGFVKVGTTYYVAVPHENAIMKCPSGGSCTPLNFDTQLLSPTDVTYGEIQVEGVDKEYLFISDSENGRVIKYEIGVGEHPQPLATGLKYPTGLAYYETTKDAVTYKYLFIAETLNHKIRKYNITPPNQFAVETVVGGGEDEACSKTAKFCKLNLPTGLFADEANHELYIADSGNNRILKMSDPGIPTSLSFEFSPGGNFALDKIIFTNDDWRGGSYNADESNLIGNNYTSKVFRNPDPLTTYNDPDPARECRSSETYFYVNENITDILDNGDKLKINGLIYTYQNSELVHCVIGQDTSLPKYKITVDNTENAGGIGNNEIVYFANPTDVVVQIDSEINNEILIGEGYQTFKIETYERGGGLRATNYHVERVGDGILGTPEDTIEVIASGGSIIFPTGVTNVYFANSGGKTIVRIEDNNEVSFSPIDINAFNVFDYISDFVVDSIDFAKFNNNKILELTINAKVDEEKTQTYKLNAVLH